MFKLLKYEFLSRREYLLIFTLVLFLAYLAIGVYGLLAGGAKAKDYETSIFSLHMVALIFSLMVSLVINFISARNNDINYLNLSLPIKLKYIWFKRIVYSFLEMAYLSLLNAIFYFMVMTVIDSNSANHFLNFFLMKGGIISLLSFSAIFWEFLIFLYYPFVLYPFLPDEPNIYSRIFYKSITILIVVYIFSRDYLYEYISKTFPYNIPQRLPMYLPQTIYTQTPIGIEISSSSAGLINIPMLITEILIFIIFIIIVSYLFEKKVEIRRERA